MLPRNYSQNLDVEAYPLRTIQSLTDLHLHNLHLDEPVAPDHHREAAHTAEECVDPRPVHPDAMRIYRAYNGKFQWTRYIPIFGPAIEAFGPKFIFGLDFMEFMSKGMANNLLQNSFLPMFTKRFKCSAMQYQRYNTVAMMGWSIKPFTALISDSFAIFGYKKRWYMVVSAIIGAVSCIIYALLPPKAGSGATAAAMAFLAGYGMANLDILSEGLYSRLMRQCPLAAPTLVSSVWWMLNFAGIIASFIEGPLSDSGMEAVGAYIAGGCILLTIPVFFVNLLGESTNRDERRQDVIALQREAALAGRGRDEADPVDDDDTLSPMELAALKKNCDLDQSFDAAFISTAVEEPYVGHDADLDAADTGAGTAEEDEIEIPTYCGGMVEFNREVIGRNHRVFIYALIMTLGVIATVIATINGSTWPLLITCTIVSAILVLVSFWALPFVVAKASLFAFLNQMLYVQITGPLNTFYVATEKEYPPGPHFSYFFYMSLTSVIGNIASVVGVTLFAYIFARRSYRLTFIITIFAEIAGSIFDLIMVKRWNVDVGIPDKLTYIWGDAVVYQVAYMLAWMPMTVLLCQLCPRGSESIVYALLAGFSNLGQTMSREIGTLLMDFALPVQTTTIPYDFSNLPWLIIICHLLIPLLLLPLVLVLIPAARVCDELDGDGNVIGEKGQTDGTARKPVNKDEQCREKPLHEEDEPTTPPA